MAKFLGFGIKIYYLAFVTNIYKDTDENILKAAQILNNGGLVGMPTETVYGLAGDATNPEAVARIFATKKRPNFNPLISHVTGYEMASQYGVFSKSAQKIALKLWPHAISFVVPRTKDCGVCDLACAGLESIAIRAPKHEVAQRLIREFGKPIAAPSANISGSISPTSAEDVRIELQDNIKMIIDGGACNIGLESTVIAVFEDEITLLRKGFFSKEDIEEIIGHKIQMADKNDDNKPRSPGMMLRHYSPNAKIRIADECDEDEIFLSFGAVPFEVKGRVFSLSQTGDYLEAASNLYGMMRKADHLKPKNIVIAPMENKGLKNKGLLGALNDRIMRAAGLK